MLLNQAVGFILKVKDLKLKDLDAMYRVDFTSSQHYEGLTQSLQERPNADDFHIIEKTESLLELGKVSSELTGFVEKEVPSSEMEQESFLNLERKK